MTFTEYCKEHVGVIERIKDDAEIQKSIEDAINAIVTALTNNRIFLICGNGGSAADSMHIAGELTGRFNRSHKPVKVLALPCDTVFMSAWSNDEGYTTGFKRQVECYGEPGGVWLGISTSGRSMNVLAASMAAKSKGMVRVGLTGQSGDLKALTDICICVPSDVTSHIQEAHILIYHYICSRVEEHL